MTATEATNDPRVTVAKYRAHCPQCDWESATEYADPLKALACADAHIRQAHPAGEAEPLSVTAQAIAAMDDKVLWPDPASPLAQLTEPRLVDRSSILEAQTD